MIAGFEQPDRGRGPDRRRRRRRPARPQAADQHRLPELRALPPPERRENVAFGLQAQEASTRPRSSGGSHAELERVGPAREAKRRPNQLSGGQQQRVALARALVNLPKVLLLDEPLGALDLKLRKGLQVELKRIQREVGITFVYVTHDQEEALTMSDRIAVMNRGRVEQIGGPEEVYERPTTTFVAGFIGVSNLMPGRRSLAAIWRPRARQRAHGRRRHQQVQHRRALPRRRPAGEAERHRQRSRAGRGDGQSVEGIVESSLYLGTATQIVGRLEGGVRMTVLCPNTDEAERQRCPGEAPRSGSGGRPSTSTWSVSRGGRSGGRADHEAPHGHADEPREPPDRR